MSDSVSNDDSGLRRRRLVTRAGVLVVWVAGVILAIRFGGVPGFWDSAVQWSYPLREVLVEIAKITVISLGLYDFLRPQPDSSSLGRTAKALGVVFVTLVWVTMFSATDQPGYAYVTGNYVLLLTGILLIALLSHVAVAWFHAIRSRHR